jgi:hypothetical protein
VIPVPIASSFLAGAILTLLIPAFTLIGLAIWHFTVVTRVHDSGLPPAQPAGTPPPVADEELPEL